MNYIKTLVLFIFSLHVSAQDYTSKQLYDLRDEALLVYFETVINDSIMAEKTARVYLERGRERGDTIMMARGYDRLSQSFSPYTNLIYTDSVIALTEKLKHISYPAFGYILKSYNYYNLDKFKMANDNAYTAYKKALSVDNLGQQLYILDGLIFNKVVWGNKKEALELQHKRHGLLMGENYLKKLYVSTRKTARERIDGYYTKQKIDSYLSFAICHHYMRQHDSTAYYLEITKTLLNTHNNTGLNFVFNELKMEHYYFKKEYDRSLGYNDLLLKRDDLKDSDFMNIFLFKGLSLYDSGKKLAGVKYLKKADSVFDLGTKLKVQPQYDLLFKKLKTHYKALSDYENQIKYLKKQLLLDSLIKSKIVGFESDLIRNIETPRLLREKEKVTIKLKAETARAQQKLICIVILSSIFILILLLYIQKQKTYKKRYLALTNKLHKQSGIIALDINISEEVIEDILKRLVHFEKNKKYLQQQISLHSLAKQLQTNPNYLSRVINFKMDKNFSQYLNDLRMDYALKELKNNATFLKYSIKAIAQECGYTNATSFSRVFYRHTGIYPSFYIKQLAETVG
jgi:AraC-like DNA-binding protein